MKRWYHSAIIFVGMSVCANAYALDEALKPLERAIIWAQKDVVTNILKKIGSLNPEDKKELIELAQKWVKYRKTAVTPLDRGLMRFGLSSIGVALSPWIAYASSKLVRLWVKQTCGPGGALLIAAPIAILFSVYFLSIGIPIFLQGYNCGETYFIEKSAHAVLKLIQDAPITKQGEKNDYKTSELSGISNEPVPAPLKK